MTSGTLCGLSSGITPGTLSSMGEEDKIRENRLRRMAGRQGLRLEKSRRRDTRATDYGTYQLVAAATNALASQGSPNGYGMTLDDVEQALTAAS